MLTLVFTLAFSSLKEIFPLFFFGNGNSFSIHCLMALIVFVVIFWLTNLVKILYYILEEVLLIL